MTQARPKVGIIGAGAMGTLFGYHFERRIRAPRCSPPTGKAVGAPGLPAPALNFAMRSEA
jgi:hypothetical protein